MRTKIIFLLLAYSQYTSCISCKLKKRFFQQPVTIQLQFKMAARTGAAAFSSLVWCLFLLLLVCVLFKFCNAAVSYSRQNLIDLGFRHNLCITGDYERSHNIPEEIARLPGSPWMVSPPGKRRRRRTERKQKRGCRSGSDARLRKQPHRPALPSLFLTNDRSITHKMDELELQMVTMFQ